jgi:L-fucose isomerase-like protein
LQSSERFTEGTYWSSWARPTAFNTVRYSEKLLQRNGISVTTVDLSEILGNANKLTADDKSVKEKLEKIHAYANTV